MRHALLLLPELKQRTASDELTDRVREAQLATERLLLSLEDAETGQRGYLLTGNPTYLAPYETAQALLDRRLEQLATVLLGADTDSAFHIEQLRHLGAAKMAELRRTIALAQQGRPADALAAVQTGEGQKLMTAIRDEIDALRANVGVQLVQARQHEWAYSLAVAGTASGLSLLVCVLLGGLYAAQCRARLALEEFTSVFGLAQGLIRDRDGCITIGAAAPSISTATRKQKRSAACGTTCCTPPLRAPSPRFLDRALTHRSLARRADT